MLVCNHPFFIKPDAIGAKANAHPAGLLVGCGKCFACRKKRSAEWSLRLFHEYSSFGYKGAFVTLTYDEQHVPLAVDSGSRTLLYSDVQKFWKRLRKRLGYKIKYFCASEYGDKTNRPHYHAIILGLDYVKESAEIVRELWPFGLVDFSPVNMQTIRYVAGYLTNKYYDAGYRAALASLSIEQPTKRCSQGLGKDWAISHERAMRFYGYITTPDGYQSSIPRYYIKKLELTQYDDFNRKVRARIAKQESPYIEELTGLSDMTWQDLHKTLIDYSNEETLEASSAVFRYHYQTYVRAKKAAWHTRQRNKLPERDLNTSDIIHHIQWI